MCWHKWDKWKVIAEGLLQMQYDSVFTGRKLEAHEQYVCGKFEHQRRECLKCGKSQLRKAST